MNLQNIQSDTQMRSSIGKMSDPNQANKND